MKKYIYLFSFLIFPLFAEFNSEDWIELSQIYVCKEGPTCEKENKLNTVFVNSYTGVGPEAGIWHVIDVSDKLPPEAKAINLMGILIITHGLSSETANLQLYFRRHGETKEAIYCGQVIEASSLNGQRTNFSAWIPLWDDLKFEFKWVRTGNSQYPQYSAYGINLCLNAWGK